MPDFLCCVWVWWGKASARCFAGTVCPAGGGPAKERRWAPALVHSPQSSKQELVQGAGSRLRRPHCLRGQGGSEECCGGRRWGDSRGQQRVCGMRELPIPPPWALGKDSPTYKQPWGLSGEKKLCALWWERWCLGRKRCVSFAWSHSYF